MEPLQPFNYIKRSIDFTAPLRDWCNGFGFYNIYLTHIDIFIVKHDIINKISL